MKHSNARITFILFFALLFLIIGTATIIWYNKPETIARSGNRCFTFFGLSDDYKFKCADYLLSQGKDCFDFGYASYFFDNIDENQMQMLANELRMKGATESDSTISLTLHRGNIIGTFRLMPNGRPYKIIVNYKEDNL